MGSSHTTSLTIRTHHVEIFRGLRVVKIELECVEGSESPSEPNDSLGGICTHDSDQGLSGGHSLIFLRDLPRVTILSRGQELTTTITKP